MERSKERSGGMYRGLCGREISVEAAFDKFSEQEDKEKQIEEQNIWKRLQ